MENNPDDTQTLVVHQAATEDIKNLILTIRGVQVLLDSDVAMLYGYETKNINLAASRNKERFPSNFRFQLTREEAEHLGMRLQSATASKRNVRYRPYAYTEQGIGMLSGLLKNKTAIQVSIGIMNAFVEMRHFINANRDVFAKMVIIDNKLLEHDRKFDEVFDLLQQPEATKQSIFYKGQFYGAFKVVIGLIEKAKTSITLVDNYADNSVLDMLSNKKNGVQVAIVTANPNKLSEQFFEKFTAQYGTVKVIASKDFHDRFIILDSKEVYAIGASLKDLGNKCFEISKVEDTAEFLVRIGRLA
jgi:hypothetical protein